MSVNVNRQITLASRPVGEPTDANFSLKEVPVPQPSEGQVLCRTRYLSLDPYMRGRMSDAASYSEPVAIGDPIVGATVSEVMESKHKGFSAGDTVLGFGGWQEYAVLNGDELSKINPDLAPVSTAVGVLGMPGMTAYTGLLNIGQPKAGETVVVAAASGAVGGLVGQIAKINGARAVGIAGAQDKCDYVVNELGFDACINYKEDNFAAALKAACPDGIDVYFENVGGKVFDTVLPLFNDFARIPVCGLIANYNMTELPPGPNMSPVLMRNILVKRLSFRGFIVWDFAEQQGEFLNAMAGWIKEGKIKYREDVVEGLENAPQAFQGLLKGKNFGKLIIKVAD
ncbi:MAG: NADP-dependent oxidoreductase [Alphaproteobacteria bacterium]|nr:NADP-dependent oxidoreductase [Rhodospirillales bacterium]MCW9046131.1 NADP-dependent oxidoreductase [Alphaproteobacteria bacterium]